MTTPDVALCQLLMSITSKHTSQVCKHASKLVLTRHVPTSYAKCKHNTHQICKLFSRVIVVITLFTDCGQGLVGAAVKIGYGIC